MAVAEEEKLNFNKEGGGNLNSAKLTNWANEPTITVLQEDLESSKEAHNQFVGKIDRWNRLRDGVLDPRVKPLKGRSQAQPKLIRRNAEWRYSALSEPFLGSNKLYDVKPVTFEDQFGAKQNETVLNWQFRTKLNRVKFIDEYIRTNTDEGSCVVRVGWIRETEDEEIEVPIWEYSVPESDMQVKSLSDAIELKQTDYNNYLNIPEEVRAAVDYYEDTQQPNVATKIGTTKKKRKKVIENKPTLQFIDPHNVYFDPSCGNDYEKAGFIIISFETSKAELNKEKDKYKNLDRVNWEQASPATHPDHESKTTQTFQFKDALRKRVVAYEYWGLYDINKDGKLKPIVATWIGSTLIRLEESPFPDKKPPFVIVNYMPIKRQVMGEPDAELLEDNQNILGAITRGMIDLLGRSANGQQGFAKGMLDIVNRRRYETGQDYEFNPNVPPTQGLIEHKYPEIPQSAMLMLGLQNNEAESLTGVKAFAGGVSGEAYGDVAAGIRGVLDAASKREMAILRRMADGIVRIGRKIITMNQIFLSEEEVIRVTNEQFVKIRREDLEGDFDLEVDISTAEVDHKKSQDLAFMLQTMGNNMDFGIVKAILGEIASLMRMPALAKLISNYEPQPDPLDQALKQAEVQKLQKEIEKIDSEIALNRARAQKELTVANQNDLDTTEQETGTKHERDLDLQQGQAEGNKELAVTKALLTPRREKETKPSVEAAVGFNELTKPKRIDNTNLVSNIAGLNPTENIGSRFYDSTQDPAVNPALNL